MRAQFILVRDGERRVGEATEIPEGEVSTIASEVLKHYQTAFKEHYRGEESIGEAVQRDLASAASIARGEGQPIGGYGCMMMDVAGKTADSTFHFMNYMFSGSLMDWIAKYESPRKDR